MTGLSASAHGTKNKQFDTQPNVRNWMSFFSISIGVVVIALASVSFITNMQLSDILSWVNINFGATFSVFYGLLLAQSGYAIFMVHKRQKVPYFFQIGMQSANGISTLALTFTLLGISLGIGSLAEQSLTPENVNQLISALTQQFSMAFMTTVIGLPSALLVRASLSIIVSKQQLHQQ